MNSSLTSLGLSDEQLRIFGIFHPHNLKKIAFAIENNLRFVHYTTADTAIKIIRSKEVWMRKATSMNDFMEIQHGLDCLIPAYNKHKKKFEIVFNGMFPNFSQRLEEIFNKWIPEFRFNTYLTCISEHNTVDGRSEDELGRLSMWRAYGGKSGVAIVMNGQSFHAPTDALKAYTSPVAYLSPMEFETELLSLLNGIEANAEWLKTLDEKLVFGQVFECFRAAVLCTKHPGFYEEREWRVIYSPSYEKSEHLKFDIHTIEGTPQPIFKIPLKNIPEQRLVGIEIPELLDRIIIGPSQYPLETREAFVSELTAAGVSDASSKVSISFIPLRQ